MYICRNGGATKSPPVGHETGKTRGDAEPSLGHGEQHHAAVRSKPPAIEIGCDLPAPDGWKREREDRIVGHGRCDGANVRSRNPNLRNIKRLSYAHRPLMHRSGNKTG